MSEFYKKEGNAQLYLISGAQLRALKTYYGQNPNLFRWLIKQIRNEQIFYGTKTYQPKDNEPQRS